MLDVCSSVGTIIHVKHSFVAAGVRDGVPLVQVELTLDVDVVDLEVRIWVDAGAAIWVDRIEIHPLSGTAAVADLG